MSPRFVEVNPERQWCDEHWSHVLSTMQGPMPINGMLATIRIFKEWMSALAERMGEAFPGPEEPERAMELLEADCPLCCYVGEERLQAIYSTCIVPERFRAMPVQYGHMLHVQEEVGGVTMVEVDDDAPSFLDGAAPPPVDPRLN